MTENTQTKHNPEKANNTTHSKTKPPWFSCLLWNSATKRGGLPSQHKAWTSWHLTEWLACV